MRSFDVLLYAVGGGSGHFVRARTLRAGLEKQGATVALAIRSGADKWFPEEQKAPATYRDTPPPELPKAAAIIVDTFPLGASNELNAAFVGRFHRKVFIARYNRRLNRTIVQDLYDEVIYPYDRWCNEWGELPLPGSCSGLLIRPDFVVSVRPEPGLLVLDPEERLSPAFRSLAARICSFLNIPIRFQSWLAPAAAAASKFLIVGAGYNSFYEFLSSGLDVMFLPIHKRFDDQHRRARLFGRSIESPQELLSWLADASEGHSGVRHESTC